MLRTQILELILQKNGERNKNFCKKMLTIYCSFTNRLKNYKINNRLQKPSSTIFLSKNDKHANTWE